MKSPMGAMFAWLVVLLLASPTRAEAERSVVNIKPGGTVQVYDGGELQVGQRPPPASPSPSFPPSAPRAEAERSVVNVKPNARVNVYAGGELHIGEEPPPAPEGPPPALPPSSPPVYSKLVLGAQGASCTEACSSIGKACNAIYAFPDNYDCDSTSPMCAWWPKSGCDTGKNGVMCTPWKQDLSPTDQQLASDLHASSGHAYKWYYQLAAASTYSSDDQTYPPLANPSTDAGDDWRAQFQSGQAGCSAGECGATRPYYLMQVPELMRSISFHRVAGVEPSCVCSAPGGDNPPPTCDAKDPMHRRVCKCDANGIR